MLGIEPRASYTLSETLYQQSHTPVPHSPQIYRFVGCKCQSVGCLEGRMKMIGGRWHTLLIAVVVTIVLDLRAHVLSKCTVRRECDHLLPLLSPPTSFYFSTDVGNLRKASCSQRSFAKRMPQRFNYQYSVNMVERHQFPSPCCLQYFSQHICPRCSVSALPCSLLTPCMSVGHLCSPRLGILLETQ